MSEWIIGVRNKWRSNSWYREKVPRISTGAAAPVTSGRFMCLLMAFFPGTVGSFSVPHPNPLRILVLWVMRWSGGTGPFGGCLAVSWIWRGRRGDLPCWGSTANPVIYRQSWVQPLQLSVPALECQDKHKFPDLTELAHPPSKAFLDALTHPPLLGTLLLGRYTVFSVLYCMVKNRMLSSKITSKARKSTPTTSTDYYPGDSSQWNQVRKGNTRHLD